MVAIVQKTVQRTERGWPGHLVAAANCLFRRNTLLSYNEVYVVVSTVGNLVSFLEKGFVQVGMDRYYETMVFFSDETDSEYHDADVSREIFTDLPWSINSLDKDNEANLMHEMIVKEMTQKLLQNTL